MKHPKELLDQIDESLTWQRNCLAASRSAAEQGTYAFARECLRHVSSETRKIQSLAHQLRRNNKETN
jgi:hypothetical protein